MNKNGTALIDSVFSPAWLVVSQLRNEQEVIDGEALYQRVCGWIVGWRRQLSEAGVSAASQEKMLYAVCALLDESVLDRQKRDSGYRRWLSHPLEAKYFSTAQAGEALWELIRAELQSPVPDPFSLTCFYRVLQLGFSGRYQTKNDEQRENLARRLNRQADAWLPTQPLPPVARPKKRRLAVRLRWLWWAGCFALPAGVWLLLSASLQRMLLQTGIA